ncbi:MAG: hypothetical protein ABJP48_01970 [Erythrobacter sp.]
MSENGLIAIVAMIGWLFLAGSAYASYQMSWSKTIRYVLIWLSIFVGGVALVTWFS